MRSPFSTTSEILNSINRIEQFVGSFENAGHFAPSPEFRATHRIQTLQGNLALEGNTLSSSQISTLLDGGSTSASKDDIKKFENANQVYEQLLILQGHKVPDLLYAHTLMMSGILPDKGKWRTGNLGITENRKMPYMAPHATRVPTLMSDLFSFLQTSTHPLIKGCVFHYELKHIQPFSSGNSKIGRVWHSLLLYEFHPIFEHIAFEYYIHKHQKEYYEVIEECNHFADSTKFIELLIKIIEEALSDFIKHAKIDPRPLRVVV